MKEGVEKPKVKCAIIAMEENGGVALYPYSSKDKLEENVETIDFVGIEEIFAVLKEYIDEISRTQDATMIAKRVVEILTSSMSQQMQGKQAIDLTGGPIDITSPKIPPTGIFRG